MFLAFPTNAANSKSMMIAADSQADTAVAMIGNLSKRNLHFAFGMSDFDEKRYLRAVLLGKGLMVAMMAVFGQSLVSSLKNPVYLVLAVLLWGGMYWVSKRFCRKHHLE